MLIKLLCFQTPLMMKFNRVICSADANFYLHKTDNPYYDDDNHYKNQDDDKKKGIFEQKIAQLQRKGERVRFLLPLFIFIYDINLI